MSAGCHERNDFVQNRLIETAAVAVAARAAATVAAGKKSTFQLRKQKTNKERVPNRKIGI